MAREHGTDQNTPAAPADQHTERPDAAALPAPNTSPETPTPPRRIWTSLVAFPAAAAGLFAGAMGGTALFLIAAHLTGEHESGEEAMESTGFLTSAMAGAMAGLAAVAVVAAILSSERTAARLMLQRPRGHWSLTALFVVATPFVGWIGAMLLTTMTGELSEHLHQLAESMAEAQGLAMVGMFLVITIGPGLAEELFFRGYMFRGLSRRLPAVAVVAVTTVLFALVHLDPQHMLAAGVLGLWLGVITWRTASVIPAIFCHIANNALSFMTSRAMYADADRVGFMDTAEWTFGIPPALLALSIAAFIASCVVLVVIGRSGANAEPSA